MSIQFPTLSSHHLALGIFRYWSYIDLRVCQPKLLSSGFLLNSTYLYKLRVSATMALWRICRVYSTWCLTNGFKVFKDRSTHQFLPIQTLFAYARGMFALFLTYSSLFLCTLSYRFPFEFGIPMDTVKCIEKPLFNFCSLIKRHWKNEAKILFAYMLVCFLKGNIKRF